MCISSAKADFSGTKGYIGEAQTIFGLVHVLGYQNKVQNNSTGPNAMILHFPAKEAMGQKNVIELGDQGHNVLNVMCDPFVKHRSRGLTKGLILSNSAVKMEIFDTGIYTVVMSNKPTLISEALKLVPENKRPEINLDLMKWYEEKYPGYSVAVCCFDNQEAKTSAPLFWWYKPINDQELFFPAVDCHSGGVPNLQEDVFTDHILTCSVLSLDASKPESIKFAKRNIQEHLKEFFPEHIVGQDYSWSGKMKNGDFCVLKTAVAEGRAEFQRVTPKI